MYHVGFQLVVTLFLGWVSPAVHKSDRCGSPAVGRGPPARYRGSPKAASVSEALFSASRCPWQWCARPDWLFLFVSVLNQFYKETTMGKISTALPLVLMIVLQAVIAGVAYWKDKKRSREVNERADFKIEISNGSGAPRFQTRSLDHVKPGDLLSFEPKHGEKVMSHLPNQL